MPKLETYANQYFTGAQASLFVGDVWIDEVYGIQFFANQSIVPVYGYSSSFFDMVGRGKVLIQGMFEINFVDTGYLYAILADIYLRNKLTGLEPVDKPKLVEQQLALLAEINAGATQGVRNKTRQDTFAQVVDLLSDMSITDVDRLSQRMLNSNSRQNARTELDKTINPNFADLSVIYSMVPFKLTGYFGHPELGGKDQGTYKELQDCFLVSNEMVIGAQDEVVKERYSFICRTHI